MRWVMWTTMALGQSSHIPSGQGMNPTFTPPIITHTHLFWKVKKCRSLGIFHQLW